MRKYRDVPMVYADATLVGLAEELDTAKVFPLDLRGFRTYRWKTRAFKIYPPTPSTRIGRAAHSVDWTPS